MKLFAVFNGWMGEGPTQVLVIAEMPERAIEIARPIFKESVVHVGDFSNYPETYWERLEAEELCSDTSKEWNSKISD